MRTTPERPGRRAVRRHRHEVELHREIDRTRQVAHEHERALEHTHEQGRPTLVVGGDPRAELGDPFVEDVRSDDRCAELRVQHGRHRTVPSSRRAATGPSSRCRRPCERRMRRPPDSSAAPHSPRTTASTRSISSADGGGGPSHRRSARRATGRGAPRSVRVDGASSPASVSRPSPSSSSSSDSARRISAWRASTGTRSRSEPSLEHRQHLVTDPRPPPPHVGVRRVVDRRRAHGPRRRPARRRDGVRATGARRAHGAGPCRRARRTRSRATR